MKARRGEDGAVTLVELVVATALAGLLLVVVAGVAASTERSVDLSAAGFGAQRNATAVLDSAISAISDAGPIGACQGSGGDSFVVALANCQVVVSTGPAVVGASSGGAPDGLCYYDYPNAQVGLVAPDLRCLVAYADGSLWSFDWPAISGETYTNCNPANCFGSGAPAPGSLPAEPTGPGQAGLLAGTVSSPASAFGFYNQTGVPLSLSVSSGPTVLAEVASVDVVASETWGAGASKDYSTTYTYSAVIGSALEEAQQSWSSI